MPYKTHPEIISERPWLEKILPHAHERGKIYCYGVKTLKTACQTFYKKGKNNIEPFSAEYEPIPWEYQYDLELHIWLNYQKITDRETSKIHDHIRKKEELGEDTSDLWERLDWIRENGVTGLPREEHWWNAAEIRWPTTVVGSEHRGQMIRDPWAQERIKALGEGYKYVCTMGGGGQGKTHTFCGFLLTMFEHFMFTQRGAKCSFSTTSEQKLKTAAWPAVTRLLTSSEKGISLTAGLSVISGDYTLKRLGNKHDTAGVMMGILLGKSINESEVIDKLTGAHGHPFYGYLIDEGQSTPLAPIKASRNFLLTGTPAFIIITGNYDRDDDSLGKNTKPKAGWESVSPSTFQWIGRSVIGQDCLVQHYNNSLSPAYLDEAVAKKYPHLPNRKKEKSTYPSALDRVLSNNEYRRFWIGWRSTDFNPDSVLNDRIVKQNSSHRPVEFDERFQVTRWFSLDTAQGQEDRNRILVCADGIDANTREWVWGVEKSIVLPKIEDIRMFEIKLIAEILRICKDNRMDSGVMDWSNLTGIWAKLQNSGINVMPLIYHNKVPDGKEVDKHSRVRELPILVNPNTSTYGHHICANKISLGAYALNKYCTTGKLRGINESLLEEDNHRPLSEEIYLRELKSVVRANSATGDLKSLDSKEDFKASHRFSPDIFDCLAQAGYYALAYRRIPLYVDAVPDEVLSVGEQKNYDTINNLDAMLLEEYL
jgi:hypothetical protein